MPGRGLVNNPKLSWTSDIHERINEKPFRLRYNSITLAEWWSGLPRKQQQKVLNILRGQILLK